MSWMLSRILLTILLFPSATLLLFVTLIILDRLTNDEFAFPTASLLTLVYLVVYWLLLWRSAVRWTPRRIGLTWACGGAAVVIGAGLWLALMAVWSWGQEIAWMLSGPTAGVLWIIGTIRIWRETVAERAARIRRAGLDTLVCPNCGYNLTGLSEARCPECGSRFTIDELLASQPERATSTAGIES